MEIMRDGGQQGDVGHRAECGVKGWGPAVGVGVAPERQWWVPTYLGGLMLNGGDAGRVDEGLGPSS